MHVISSPSIPFWGHIPDGVHPGLAIHIDGHIPHYAERFAINLVKGNEVGHRADHCIALHLNPRVAENYIVLNSRHHSNWGSEDRHQHNHTLHRGHGFNITIHVDSEYYRISINGQHLCNFHHRIPYHEVGVFNVDGDVEIRSIEYRREHGGHVPHYTPAFTPAYTTGYQAPINTFVPGTFDQPDHHHHESHHHESHHHDHHHGHHHHNY